VRELQATGESALTGGDPSTAKSSRFVRPVVLLAAVAVAIVVADLATKVWVVHHYADGHVTTLIPRVLEIEEARNGGAAFGIAGGATILFTIVAVAVIAFIVRNATRIHHLGWAVALGLLLGGAIGNLGDRVFRSPGVFRGHVVDWIYLHHWPIFNLADSGIVIGGLLAVALAGRGYRLDGSREQPSDGPDGDLDERDSP